MKRLAVAIGVALAAALCLLAGCDVGDNGGNGADFDETQYYTKGEIDQMFYTRLQTDTLLADYYTKADSDGRLPIWGGNESLLLDSTRNTYATGLAVNVPSGRTILLLSVWANDPSTTKVRVYLGTSEANSGWQWYPDSFSSHMLLLYDVSTFTTGTRIWVVDYDGSDLQATTNLWFY